MVRKGKTPTNNFFLKIDIFSASIAFFNVYFYSQFQSQSYVTHPSLSLSLPPPPPRGQKREKKENVETVLKKKKEKKKKKKKKEIEKVKKNKHSYFKKNCRHSISIV